MVDIRLADPGDTDVLRMIEQLDEYQLAIYPAESNHLDSVDELTRDNVRFIGAYDGEFLLGIGAIKYLRHDCEYGEIKRVWVSPDARGLGVSKRIMEDLECDASSRDIGVLRLETGVHQPEAIGLYEKLGYRFRERYGDYSDDPLSVFMEKLLT